MSSWSTHQRRSPKSEEPGTDFYCPIGTPVLAPEDGLIFGSGNTITPPTGRWVGVKLDNGMAFRAMHFSRLVKTSGRVKRGDILGYSGASGYGYEDWSWNPNTGGAHVHVTLWPTWSIRFGYDQHGRPYTVDFMNYVGGSQSAGGGSSPEIPIPPRKKKNMQVIRTEDGGGFRYALVGEFTFQAGQLNDTAQANLWAQTWGDYKAVSTDGWNEAINMVNVARNALGLPLAP